MLMGSSPGREASSTIRRFSSRDQERRDTFTMSLPTVAIVLSGNALNLHVPSGTTVKCPLLVDGHLPSLTMTTRDPTLAGTAVGGQQPTLTVELSRLMLILRTAAVGANPAIAQRRSGSRRSG